MKQLLIALLAALLVLCLAACGRNPLSSVTTIESTTGQTSAESSTGAEDTSAPDGTMPDSSLEDTSVPDTSVPDSTESDSSVTDTAEPDTSVSDTTEPDTSASDTAAPEPTPDPEPGPDPEPTPDPEPDPDPEPTPDPEPDLEAKEYVGKISEDDEEADCTLILLGDRLTVVISQRYEATPEELEEVGLSGTLVMTQIQKTNLTVISLENNVVSTKDATPLTMYEAITFSGTAAEAYKAIMLQQMEAALEDGDMTEAEYERNVALLNGEEVVVENDDDEVGEGQLSFLLNDTDGSFLLSSISYYDEDGELAYSVSYEYTDGVLTQEIYIDIEWGEKTVTTYYADGVTRKTRDVYDVDDEGNETLRHHHEYYENGERKVWVDYYPNGEKWSENEYYENGERKSSVGYWGNGIKSYEREYDSYGNRLLYVDYDSDGNVESYERYVYEYYDDGSFKKVTEYGLDDKLIVVREYHENGNDKSYVYYYENGNKEVEWHYNENGDDTLVVDYDEDGNITSYSRYEYEYYDDGSVKTRTCYDENDQVTAKFECNEDGSGKSSIWYDENGQISDKWERTEDGGEIRYSYSDGVLHDWVEYDADGELVKYAIYMYEYVGQDSETVVLQEISVYDYVYNDDLGETVRRLVSNTRYFYDDTDGSLLAYLVLDYQYYDSYKYNNYGNAEYLKKIIEGKYYTPEDVCFGYYKEEFNENGDIVRSETIQYDEHGNVIVGEVFEVTFYDNGQRKKVVIKDLDGNELVVEIEYNELGDIIKSAYQSYDEETGVRVFEYDEDGNVLYWTWEYEYHDDGTKAKETEYDGYGNVRQVIEYDEYGNTTLSVRYDVEGNVLQRSKYSYEYDEDGNVTTKTEYDAQDRIDTVWTTDEEGNRVILYYYYFYDVSDGYQVNTYVSGKKVKMTRYDADGNILFFDEPLEYHENGNLKKEKRTEYDEETGEISCISFYEYYEDGYSWKKLTVYDGQGNLRYIATYNEDGSDTHTYYYPNGNKESEIHDNANGDEILRVYYDEDGNITSYSRYEYEYYEDGTIKTTTRYDEDGNIRYEYKNNEDGSYTIHRYYSSGVLEEKYECDADGNIIFCVGYDEDGNITYKAGEGFEEYYSDGILRSRYEYDEYGNQTLRIVYDEQGNVSWTESCEYEYDEDGNVLQEIMYQNNVKRRLTEYDEYGNRILDISYNDDGSISRSDRYEYEYDDEGNILKETIYWNDVIRFVTEYADDGSYVAISYYESGNMRSEFHYNSHGNEILTILYYDTATKEINSYNRYEREYYEIGSPKKIACYDINGNLISLEEFEIEERGYITRVIRRRYNTSGELISYSHQTSEYFEDSDLVKRGSEYNINGQMIYDSVFYESGMCQYEISYYENGNIEHECHYDQYGPANVTLSISYDEEGNITYYERYSYEYYPDHWTTKVLTSYDQDGNVLWVEKYDEYGNVIES